MTYEATLDCVRELSERATLRPAPHHLALAKPEDLHHGPRPAIVAWEDRHLPKIGGDLGTAGNHKRHQKHAVKDHCPTCGKRPQYCYCEVRPRKKDFMQAALEKTESKIERLPFVVPAGE